MLHMVAAPITSHTDGSAITYGTGFRIGPAVDANLTFQSNDNPDFGDDIELDNDNGITGYSGTVENNYIDEDVAAKLYGWDTSGSSGDEEYEATGDAAPMMGFGYLKKTINRGVLKIRAFWYHKAQFVPGTYNNAHTKERNTNWQHDVSNISGYGAYIDGTGKPRFFRVKKFTGADAIAQAEAWLDDKANVQ